MVLSLVPSPDVNVSPVVPDNVRVPLVTDTVTSTALVPASASLIEIWFPFTDENTLLVSSLVLCAPGTVLVVVSVTSVTVTAID